MVKVFLYVLYVCSRIVPMTSLLEWSPLSTFLHREIPHAKTSWISLICRSVCLNTTCVCIGKKKGNPVALAMFLPFIKYLGKTKGLHSLSLQYTSLTIYLKIIMWQHVIINTWYMKKHETERGKKDEWVKCENTCCWWGWKMYDICTSFPAVWTSSMGNPKLLTAAIFFAQNTREKLQHTAWTQGCLQSKLSFCFLKLLFQRKINDFS